MNVTYKTIESTPSILKMILKRNSEIVAHVPYKDSLISIVALDLNKPVGVIITYELNPKELRINHILVTKDFRRKGIATEFLNIIEKQARVKGFEKLSLLVHIHNWTAKHLYTKNGFVEKVRSENWEFLIKLLN